ncbi:MAG: hypothetical protein HS126_38595 [Anaerolineales bacterium]|nr:hypothetical protein [Anaerolineales bacterium]
MARSYKRYRVEGFPELTVGEEIHTTHQLGIRFPDEPQDDQVHSQLRLLGESEHPQFLKYKVQHEVLRLQLFRHQGLVHDRLITIEEMMAYRDPTSPHIYFKGTRFSDQFLKQLARSIPQFHAYKREIDLNQLGREIERKVKGGWFGNLKIQDVRVAGIFGGGVAEAEEWERSRTTGKLTSVVIELSIANEGLSAMLFSDGGLLIYTTQEEREDLNTLIQLDQIIQDFTLRDDVAITL